MKCPRKDCNNEARMHPMYGVMPCMSCQRGDTRVTMDVSEDVPVSKLHRIQSQRDRHGADMLQPFIDGSTPNPDFIKEYPDLVHDYFTDEQLKRSDV